MIEVHIDDKTWTEAPEEIKEAAKRSWPPGSILILHRPGTKEHPGYNHRWSFYWPAFRE